MTVLEIMEWPAPVLSQKSEPVTTFGPELEKLVADMHETMADAGGIGLAANQINIAQRILVINIPYKKSKYPEEEAEQPWHNKAWTFINPEIVKKAGKTRYQEGCLSFLKFMILLIELKRFGLKLSMKRESLLSFMQMGSCPFASSTKLTISMASFLLLE